MPSWNSNEGIAALTSVVSARIPSWTTGLREWQIEPILRILDSEDVLLCTATGAGKSALFIVPILCHLEVAAHPELYPKSPVRKHPLGMVVTPTKGLARNLVCHYALDSLLLLTFRFSGRVCRQIRSTSPGV
ncbi:hypothetical protein FB45DRAFT_749306 [Roridomyces roridus]|uniref:DEAD/DEAH-box helicase domain-containing protein n=1 Tax=Roridomyces roridus TaxID=1738132 RepID=A0AAD7FMI2_9AGAR|nr:hypothetical protein FB45DRAFT_749306 [Roridomyces roridus]